jgi:LPXTG-site transpeptidase (sortase) family protein
MLQIEQSVRFKKMLIMTFILVLLMGALYFLSYPSFFGIDFSYLKSFNKNQKNDREVLSVQVQEEDSVFEKPMEPIYSFPERIVVETLGIDVEIVSVGVDADGYLEAPKDWDKAGWYKRSAKPGEIGGILINAHYDDNYGRPAAFWKLKNINVGDKVSVLDTYGRSFDYKVVDVYHLSISDPNRVAVFEPFKDGASVMTLITCGGFWSHSHGTYDKRLVVNAELIQE